MKAPRKFFSYVSFIDLLFNSLLVITYLFMLALVLINPPSKKSDVEKRAEYMIIMEWPDDSIDDVDLWVKTPSGDIVFFRSLSGGKNSTGLFLEKDDRGQINDHVINEMGIMEPILLNREVITIRGTQVGEYAVNVHMYDKLDGKPTQVTVQVVKVNPYSLKFKGKVIMEVKRAERHMTRFTIAPSGYMTNIGPRSIMFANATLNAKADSNAGRPGQPITGRP